jgi:hypothetical protein
MAGSNQSPVIPIDRKRWLGTEMTGRLPTGSLRKPTMRKLPSVGLAGPSDITKSVATSFLVSLKKVGHGALS